MNFGLSERDCNLLEEIVLRPLKAQGVVIWVFGSRARGDFRPFSDLDLMYEIPQGQSLPKGLMFEIKSNLEESDLPIKVDLVDFSDMADSYREKALKERVVV